MNSFAWLLMAVLGAEQPQPVHFDTEIIPVLTKAGCNAGACHGAAAGRGGFHLSLLGGNPSADHEAITLALEGRRINQVRPELSLLLMKPTEQLDHGGGSRLGEAGPGAARILVWIREGAKRGAPRKLTSFEVTPLRHISAQFPTTVPLRAVARFDDGPLEDVTTWTVFTSSDAAAVEIDESNVVRVQRRGQHVVVARFLDRVVPIQLSAPFFDEAIDLADELRVNFIDEEVLQTLSDLRIPVSPAASDAAYLRRVSLDLTGSLPEPQAIEAYVTDRSAKKRLELVERLLESDNFVDFWTLKFARSLQLHSLPNDKEGMQAYVNWLRGGIRRDTGFDQIAHQLLTATGDSHVVGPANFGRMASDARAHAELVGRFFLGVRLGCANCHNHPLDRWTQDDYHGLAAVFAGLDRGRQVQFLARGAVTNVRTGEPAVPRIPGVRYLSSGEDHRKDFAHWLTTEQNQYFARVMANRLWQAMFGRGLVEPVDDLRDTNPATHPELLHRLAKDFAEHGYRIRYTLRQIALSSTYRRTAAVTPGNELDDRFYSRAYPRPLEPEVLADAISEVTGVPNQYGMPATYARAVTLIDPLTPGPSLDILGRCSRADGCDISARAATALPTQLHLLNGNLINAKLTAEDGRLHQLVEAGKSDEEIVREFYLRGLGRLPTNDELKRWLARLSGLDSSERMARLEDFVWSMLCSEPFLTNR